MKNRILAALLGLLLGLGAQNAIGGYSSGGSAPAASVTGGSCTNQPATGINTAGTPQCGNVPETAVTNLPTDLANLTALIGAGAPGATGNAVVTSGGCTPAWTGSGLNFAVPACSYYIQGTLYSSTAATVTLSAADASNTRIDTIVVNTSSAADKVDGTAAANPTVPTVDPTTQLALTHVTVAALATEPSGAANESIYDEDNDWTTTEGTGWASDDTANPHAGTKDVKATGVASGALMRFIRSSTLTLNGYQQLNLWVAPGSGTWANGRTLQITFRDTNQVQVGAAITLQNGSFGFSRTSTSYQLIAIPLGLFNVPAGVSIKELRLNPQGSGGTFTFYVDDVALQTTANQILPGGSTYATQYRDPSGLTSGTGPGTSGYVLTSTGSSGPPTYQAKLPAKWWMPFAFCQNTTAGLLWDSPTSNAGAAACVTGSNTQKGVADFDATTDESLQITARLPSDYDSAQSVSASIKWLAAATTGAAGLCVQVVCVADAETDDPAFPAQSSSNCTSDTAKGTTLQTNDATISSVPVSTGTCAAGELMHIQVSRDANGGAVTDDMSGDARLIGLELTIPRN